MKLHFLGANQQVTGSCTVLETARHRLMVDCGLFQEPHFFSRNHDPFGIDVQTLDFLLLTHAHLDHCGLIPRLLREGFRGRILATAPTIELSRIVLIDAARLQAEEVSSPLYTLEEAEQAARRMEATPYWETLHLADDLAVRFRDAGHILGSACVEVAVQEGDQKYGIAFSGDLGPGGRPLVRDPAPIDQPDVLVLESTYGDADHEIEAVEDILAGVIERAVRAHGKLLIPAFAVERAQDLLFYLGRLLRQHRVPHVPVFLDSPMAVETTKVFLHHIQTLQAQAHELIDSADASLDVPGLVMTVSRDESIAINKVEEPAIIIAGSGMCTGGRILHHLARHIEQPECTVLFTGYQAGGTLGRQILEGAPSVTIDGQTHQVRVRIERLHGLSGHADQSSLLRWLGHLERPPRRVFLNHGEPEAAEALADLLRQRQWEVSVPTYGQEVDLD